MPEPNPKLLAIDVTISISSRHYTAIGTAYLGCAPSILIETLRRRHVDRWFLHILRQRGFKPENKGENCGDRDIQIFGDNFASVRGEIDRAGQLRIFEQRHVGAAREFADRQRDIAAAARDDDRRRVEAGAIAQRDREMRRVGQDNGGLGNCAAR